MFKPIKKSLVSIISLFGIFMFLFFIQIAEAENETPENIIYMIGDGMGSSHLTLSRVLIGPMNMNRFSNGGMVMTYSANELITDSAAGGTALATGYKTNNGVISLAADGKELKTALEVAKERGKATGLVTTTRITHATPASFYAHVKDRNKEDAIAEQLIYAGIDIFFGGGMSYLLPSSAEGSKRKDNLDLINELKNMGYEIVKDRSGLLNVNVNNDLVAGIFSLSHMSYELDRKENEPSISEMTKKAIEVLSNSRDGFFLMVEGGRIDHAAHANDAASVFAETLAFDKAVGVVLDFAISDRNTLVVVTADHSTGALTLGKGMQQWYNPTILRQTNASFEENLFPALLDGGNIVELFANDYGITNLTNKEIENINSALQTGDLDVIKVALGEVVTARTNIYFASIEHEGSAVPLLTYGPGAFGGFLDNTQVGKRVKSLLSQEKELLYQNYGGYLFNNITPLPTQ